jgi:acyl carrier protein
MSADRTRVFTDVVELLTAISESLPPGEEITEETRLMEDLELQSLALANLSGRVQTKYGSAANLVPFFAVREEGPFTNLRVGELVDYITGVLVEDEASQAAAAAGGETGVLVTGLIERVVRRCPAPWRTFADDGFTLSDMLQVTSALEALFGEQSKTLLLDTPTVAELASYLDQHYGAERVSEALTVRSPEGSVA